MSFFNCLIDDRVFIIWFGVVTIVVFRLIEVWLKMLVSMVVGGVAVILHEVFRAMNDLHLNKEEGGGSISVVCSPKRPMSCEHL